MFGVLTESVGPGLGPLAFPVLIIVTVLLRLGFLALVGADKVVRCITFSVIAVVILFAPFVQLS